MNIKHVGMIICLCMITIFFSGFFSSPKDNPLSLHSLVKKRHLNVNVHTIGDLEAAKSTIISSRLSGEQSKVIYLSEDGANVKKGDLLVKIDATSYEDKVEDLKAKIKDQESHIVSLEKALEWEIHQKDVEKNLAASDLFLAELEYDKAIKNEAPLEEKRLKSAMDKSKGKCKSLQGYYEELEELAKDGYCNEFEMKQTQSRIREEKENFETAEEQYLAYVNTTYPMQKHKNDIQLKRAQMKSADIEDNSNVKIFKAESNLAQSRVFLDDLKNSLRHAQEELTQTELKAPTDGMVVLKEEFRSGQRRKPRIGDSLVKNQAILDLPDLSSMVVRTRVREVDLHKIQIGKDTTIQVDAFPELSFSGKVTYIGVLALKDPLRTGEEKFFDVHVALHEKNHCLRPGMTARVSIHSQDIKEAITIPYQALFEGDDHATYCYVQTNRRYQKRKIEVGTINEQWVVVTSGLKEGERVCLTTPPQEARL